MNRIFGFSRNALVLVGIVVAIVLVVVAGMLVIGSAAIRAMMVPGLQVEGVSLLALLVTIIVLLSAVFVLLLVLFWCCCRQPRKASKEGALPADMLATLLPMLPLMQQLPNLLRDVGVAIYQAGKTIGWVQENIAAAADGLDTAAENLEDATTFRVPRLVETSPDSGLWLVDINPFNAAEINPLEDLLNTLTEMGENLVPTDTDDVPLVPLTINNVNVTVANVSDTLVSTGKTLGHIANTLHANPPPPSELLS